MNFELSVILEEAELHKMDQITFCWIMDLHLNQIPVICTLSHQQMFKYSIGGNVEILDSFGPSWQCDGYFMLWFDVSCIEYVGGIQSSLEFLLVSL
jgi:hypothetical protein